MDDARLPSLLTLSDGMGCDPQRSWHGANPMLTTRKIMETSVRGAVMYAPGDVRVEERSDPRILKATDAIIRLSATCICGSDLWPYRGFDAVDGSSPMGHEYVGIVEEAGDQIRTIKPGQFVIGSFVASDNTCEICQAGYRARASTACS